MTLRILSDSESARKTNFTKEVDEFVENGLTAQRIPQGTKGINARQDLSSNTMQSKTTMSDLSDQAGITASEPQEGDGTQITSQVE